MHATTAYVLTATTPETARLVPEMVFVLTLAHDAKSDDRMVGVFVNGELLSVKPASEVRGQWAKLVGAGYSVRKVDAEYATETNSAAFSTMYHFRCEGRTGMKAARSPSMYRAWCRSAAHAAAA